MRTKKPAGKARTYWISPDVAELIAKYAKRNELTASKAINAIVRDAKKQIAA
jgi:hypothetical protein